jgi:hypothetical protein
MRATAIRCVVEPIGGDSLHEAEGGISAAP